MFYFDHIGINKVPILFKAYPELNGRIRIECYCGGDKFYHYYHSTRYDILDIMQPATFKTIFMVRPYSLSYTNSFLGAEPLEKQLMKEFLIYLADKD